MFIQCILVVVIELSINSGAFVLLELEYFKRRKKKHKKQQRTHASLKQQQVSSRSHAAGGMLLFTMASVKRQKVIQSSWK